MVVSMRVKRGRIQRKTREKRRKRKKKTRADMHGSEPGLAQAEGATLNTVRCTCSVEQQLYGIALAVFEEATVLATNARAR